MNNLKQTKWAAKKLMVRGVGGAVGRGNQGNGVVDRSQNRTNYNVSLYWGELGEKQERFIQGATQSPNERLHFRNKPKYPRPATTFRNRDPQPTTPSQRPATHSP